MFRTTQDYRTFLTIVMTYALDLVGYSIVFPVLAPLLLNPHLHFFSPDVSELVKTTTLGLIYALFGIAQFIGAPLSGALADHFGRYKVFVWSIALSVLGYFIMAYSIYEEDLFWLFFGRALTGLCSGNFALAQSATADITKTESRSKAFGILLGVGGLGFVVGPWFGGKLANPDWLRGSGAFIFAGVAALINLIMVFFFFTETKKGKKDSTKLDLLSTIKDIRLVFHVKTLRIILITQLLYLTGWAFYVIFSPTYLVQKFSLNSDKIGDFFAYMAIWWCFGSMYLNKELTGKFSIRQLSFVGMCIGGFSLVCFLLPGTLWPYWLILAINQIGGSLAWVNLGALLSVNASEDMQGRAMGVGGSMWSFGQIIAPLIAGPLAGWNMYAPITVGALCIFTAFIYFLIAFRSHQETSGNS